MAIQKKTKGIFMLNNNNSNKKYKQKTIIAECYLRI